MIGMMYLVLTAMLALNVSADVLEAFTKVQQGLSSTISNLTKKNAETYNAIEMAYDLNATKMKETRTNTMLIREKTRDLFEYIDSLKTKMVKIADGPAGDVRNIQARDNLDVGGQVMLQQKEGKVLKDKLDDFRETLLGFIDERDTVLRNAVIQNLNTDSPKTTNQSGPQTWESAYFESIPLTGVVTILTMLQANALSMESDVVNYLFTSIDAESFKFNKLEALVIPESNYVLTGDQFKARIMLAAVDTTQQPQVLVGGRSIPYREDYAYYTATATKPGVYPLTGVINFITPSGATLPRSFKYQYEVADPAVVISPTKMNVFYVGVDNPVSLAVPGMSSDAIQPEITNGEIHKGSDGTYIVRPKRAGQNSEITVYAQMNGQKRKLQTQTFRVKDVPDPVAKVADMRGGTIRRNLLLAAGRVDVVMENFDFDLKFTVQGFNVLTIVDGYSNIAESRSGAYTAEQTKMFQNAKRNQVVIFEDIMVKGPDGSQRKLPPISFKIE
jgi:gliding motility-associated protein GldM